MHWHDAIEILHFERGTFDFSVNMNRMTVGEDCYVFVESGRLHTIRCESGFLEQAILFEPGLLELESVDESEREVLSPLSQGTLHLPGMIGRDEASYREISAEFGKIRRIFETNGVMREDQRLVSDPAAQLRIRASLTLILAALWDAGMLSREQKPEDPRAQSLKKVIAYVREHYDTKIYIAELAAIMNMNEQYFCRFFKKAMGKAPVRYINEIRIRQAMMLLGSTQQPVTEVAMACGFGNMGHFIEEFRKISGTTPLDYRRKVRNSSL